MLRGIFKRRLGGAGRVKPLLGQGGGVMTSSKPRARYLEVWRGEGRDPTVLCELLSMKDLNPEKGLEQKAMI